MVCSNQRERSNNAEVGYKAARYFWLGNCASLQLGGRRIWSSPEERVLHRKNVYKDLYAWGGLPALLSNGAIQ